MVSGHLKKTTSFWIIYVASLCAVAPCPHTGKCVQQLVLFYCSLATVCHCQRLCSSLGWDRDCKKPHSCKFVIIYINFPWLWTFWRHSSHLKMEMVCWTDTLKLTNQINLSNITQNITFRKLFDFFVVHREWRFPVTIKNAHAVNIWHSSP